MLVDLLSATTPVAQWPTQIADGKTETAKARKRDRTARARDAERGQAARSRKSRYSIFASSARRANSLMVSARWGRPSLPAVVRMRLNRPVFVGGFESWRIGTYAS
ncbi:hypothetical protein, partial [Streptomyces lavendulae]|uniref:hypothetical protein n=1 Tax=Streptomyces lavendulae TaxID=1914 RepID=UPI0031E5C646